MKTKQLMALSLVFFLFAVVLNAQTLQDGIKQIDNENFAKAKETFMTLNVKDPKNPIYAYYLGEINYKLENYDGAKSAYSKGLEVSQKCDACRIGLAKLKLDAGNVMEADKDFAYALKGNTKNAQVYLMAGQAYLYSKNPNPTKALEYLIKSRDIDPNNSKAWISMGDAYISKQDLGNAMSSYETAVKKDKNDPETYVKMAKIWSSSKNFDLAVEKLETASTIAPDYAQAYKDLYEVYIRTNKYSKVLPVLQKYVALAGDDIDAKVRLVKFLCFQAKDYERAIEEGNKIIATNPDQYTVYRWLAWSYYESGKMQESFDNSKKLMDIVAADPGKKLYSSDYEYYAKAASKLGNAEIAESMYNKIIEMDSSRRNEIYGMLAKSNYDAKNYAKAIEWYTKKNEAVGLNNTELYFFGQANYFTDKYAAADSAFAKVTEATPTYGPAWIMRAKCALYMDPEQLSFTAKPYYEKYISIAEADKTKNAKNLVAAYNYLGTYYVKQNDFTQGKSYFQMSVGLDGTETNQAAIDALKLLEKK